MSFKILGTISSISDLPNEANIGDIYICNNNLYVYDNSNKWANVGSVTNSKIIELYFIYNNIKININININSNIYDIIIEKENTIERNNFDNLKEFNNKFYELYLEDLIVEEDKLIELGKFYAKNCLDTDIICNINSFLKGYLKEK